MTPAMYKQLRKQIGTQDAVAKLLGVNRVTVACRESGKYPINNEAAIAIQALAAMNHKPKRKS